jgi:hypothetical protein
VDEKSQIPTAICGTPSFQFQSPPNGRFYEKVTDVNPSSLFFLCGGFVFSLRLPRMLFSTLFLYALSLSHSDSVPIGVLGEVDAASFESASLRA